MMSLKQKRHMMVMYSYHQCAQSFRHLWSPFRNESLIIGTMIRKMSKTCKENFVPVMHNGDSPFHGLVAE